MGGAARKCLWEKMKPIWREGGAGRPGVFQVVVGVEVVTLSRSEGINS